MIFYDQFGTCFCEGLQFCPFMGEKYVPSIKQPVLDHFVRSPLPLGMMRAKPYNAPYLGCRLGAVAPTGYTSFVSMFGSGRGVV